MDPNNKSNGWGAKWNQTGDLTITEGKNLFTLSGNVWDGSTTTWSLGCFGKVAGTWSKK